MLSNEQYRLIVESSPNMIWRADLTTKCDYFNKTWLAFTGRSLAQELGFGWAEGVHPDDYSRCVKVYLEHFEAQSAFEMDYRLKRFDGEYRWINDRGVPYYDDDGIFLGFIGSCMDVSERIEGQRLIEMAQYDLLCHTYNRQFAHQLMQKIFRSAKELGNPMSILMIDIDWFKQVNDTYGHNAGDIVLARVAGIIGAHMRDDDILGRYGGDEFFACVSADMFAAEQVADRILSAVSETDISIGANRNLRVGVSIGVKELTVEKTLDELIDLADQKLYEAKHHGKNRVVV